MRQEVHTTVNSLQFRGMSCLRTKWGIPLISIVCVTLGLILSRRINYGRYYGRSRFRMSSRGPSIGSSGQTFLYFAYGSNLLTERIHFQNPSATFVDAAKLDGYKLEFRLPSEVNVVSTVDVIVRGPPFMPY